MCVSSPKGDGGSFPANIHHLSGSREVISIPCPILLLGGTTTKDWSSQGTGCVSASQALDPDEGGCGFISLQPWMRFLAETYNAEMCAREVTKPTDIATHGK